MYTKDTIPTKLVQYKGGGYDGCFWEWNYAIIQDKDHAKQFLNVASSGRNGINNLSDMLDHLNNDSGYYLYNLDKDGLTQFANESNPLHVKGVAQFLYDNLGLEIWVNCTSCNSEFLAYDGTLESWQGCGGIESSPNDIICPDCISDYTCEWCNEFSRTVEYIEQFDESLCEWCNDSKVEKQEQELNQIFNETVNHQALINGHFLSAEVFGNAYCINCESKIDYDYRELDESLTLQCQG